MCWRVPTLAKLPHPAHVMAAWYTGNDMIGLTPRHTYNASLGLVLRALAHMRAGGALLHAAEWRMYSKALQSDCICQRMAVVAAVSGDSEEVWPPIPVQKDSPLSACPAVISFLCVCLSAYVFVSCSNSDFPV